MANNKQIDEQSIYSNLVTVPPSDINFRSNLQNASADIIKRALAAVPELNNLSKRKILEARLRKLENAPSDAAEKLKTADAQNTNILRKIPISQIAVSRFEPQARRRAKFKPEDIKSLADSIRIHGLRQPILVRPVHVPGEKIKIGRFRDRFRRTQIFSGENYFSDN